jgi:cytochrome b
METKQIRVWDLPTRLFHWSLLVAFVAAWLTGDVLEIYKPHELIGFFYYRIIKFSCGVGVCGFDNSAF